MNSIFGMLVESWILRVSCKVSDVIFARDPKYSMNIQKIEFIAYIYILL